jgi:hypothetical protein
MAIENYCEFIKKIHADPLAKITGLTIGDLYSLQDHVNTCEQCIILTNEVLARYKNVPTPETGWDKTKYN